MSDAQKKTRKASTANSGKQPSTRSRAKRGTAAQTTRLDPAMTKSTDATTAPVSMLPCDENGDVLLPLFGDEEEAPAPDNTTRNLINPMEKIVREYWTIRYEVGGDTIEAEVLDPETGEFRVIGHTARTSAYKTPGYCPHAFLNRVAERKGKVISEETLHIITDFDFDGITRTKMESFISAFINYATTIMYTSIQSHHDFEDFVAGYYVK